MRVIIGEGLYGRAQLHHPPARQHGHARALQHAGGAVREEQHRGAAERPTDRVDNLTLRFVVHVSCRFIDQKDLESTNINNMT